MPYLSIKESFYDDVVAELLYEYQIKVAEDLVEKHKGYLDEFYDTIEKYGDYPIELIEQAADKFAKVYHEERREGLWEN